MRQTVCGVVVLVVLAGAAPVGAAQEAQEPCTAEVDVPVFTPDAARSSFESTTNKLCELGRFAKVALQVPDSSHWHLRLQLSEQTWHAWTSIQGEFMDVFRNMVSRLTTSVSLNQATLLVTDPSGTTVGSCSGGRATAVHCTPEGGYVNPPPGYVSPPPAAPAPRTVETSLVKAHCEKEWPTDFRMQAYCQRRAFEAAQELNARTMDTPDRRTIRTQCLSEWSTDVRMVNYCEKRQLDALHQLGRDR